MAFVDSKREPRELADARQGLSWRQRRVAICAVGRGRRVKDPALAALAVALARDALRRRALIGPGPRYLAAVVNAATAVTFVAAVAQGGLNAGSGLLGLMVLMLVASVVRGVHQTERWQRAEAANRNALLGSGFAFVEDEVLVLRNRPPALQIAQTIVVQWTITDLDSARSLERSTATHLI